MFPRAMSLYFQAAILSALLLEPDVEVEYSFTCPHSLPAFYAKSVYGPIPSLNLGFGVKVGPSWEALV